MSRFKRENFELKSDSIYFETSDPDILDTKTIEKLLDQGNVDDNLFEVYQIQYNKKFTRIYYRYLYNLLEKEKDTTNAKRLSWIYYLLANDNRNTKAEEFLLKSVEMNNSAAIIQYSSKYAKKLSFDQMTEYYLMAYELGEDVLLAIQSKIGYDNKENKEDYRNKLLKLAHKLTKYKKKEVYSVVASIYHSLNQHFSNEYQVEYLKSKIRSDQTVDIYSMHYTNYIAINALKNEVELEDKYEELKTKYDKLEKAYLEIKTLREMDFNNILGNIVDGYLNDDLKN